MRRARTSFENYLRAHGLKLTRQREAILDRIFQAGGHFSADELHERMQSSALKVGKATVYRTLELLAKGGFLEAHDFGTGSAVYEKILGRAHHDHMVCMACGKVLEFHCEEIEKLQQEQAARYHFQLVSHSHHMFGYCSACSKKREKRKSAAVR